MEINMTEELQNRFTYHSPTTEQQYIYQAIRNAGLSLASIIEDLCPDSREKSLALTKVDEAVMWGNASVARRS